MKRILLFTALFSLATIGFAQDVNKANIDAAIKATDAAKADLAKVEVKESNWKCTGIMGANMSATGLWNWAAGGNNNATGVAFANVSLLYKKNKLAWATNLDTELGVSYLESNTTYPWQKSNDKINFTTKLGYEFADKWYATVLGSFKSQFIRGYNYSTDTKDYISNWLSPSYTDISLGIDWKPNDIFTTYLSPIAGRLTTATDTALCVKYAVDPEKRYKAELGLTFKGQVTYAQIKNFKVLSSLSLFTPYSDKFGTFDVDWDVAVSYQFMKVLNVTLSTALKYYDAVMINGKVGQVQFKTVLGLGLGYSF